MKPTNDLGPLPRYAVNHYERDEYFSPPKWTNGNCHTKRDKAVQEVKDDWRPSVARDIKTGRIVACNRGARKLLK